MQSLRFVLALAAILFAAPQVFAATQTRTTFTVSVMVVARCSVASAGANVTAHCSVPAPHVVMQESAAVFMGTGPVPGQPGVRYTTIAF
jgi:hypothetical protein